MDNRQDRILAQVAGNPIMESDLMEAMASMGQRAQAYNNPQGRAILLDQLIARLMSHCVIDTFQPVDVDRKGGKTIRQLSGRESSAATSGFSVPTVS